MRQLLKLARHRNLPPATPSQRLLPLGSVALVAMPSVVAKPWMRPLQPGKGKGLTPAARKTLPLTACPKGYPQVRIKQESETEIAVEEVAVGEDDGDGDDDNGNDQLAAGSARRNTRLDGVPEDTRGPWKQDDGRNAGGKQPTHFATPQQRAALRELYAHEILALISCFALPLLSAYLLHFIRVQLSRPSEGLVSNYNLTIFLLASELRAFSHSLKLVQSRTLHLQRVIHGNPFASPTQIGSQIEEMLERLERLEARSLAEEFVRDHGQDTSSVGGQDRATATREVRNAIQPDLDALNRAVRRYEKKATMLQYQTDCRFSALDLRMDDALALAAIAAKNSNSKSIFVRIVESLMAVLLFPLNALVQVWMLATRSLFSLTTLGKKPRISAKHGRANRVAKQSSKPRYSGVMKK
ncbi:hypothetical protein UVI_02046620 [Ustilaginoidea virens]|uniref:Uncharacterized protein n=1 Tax=Ustilaginoidea virens TaxID=1159556 RepID=A0A1B5L0I4_USTVR|nr:hypothetical protein UVI_02046620 [Ustilaginoidea virens]